MDYLVLIIIMCNILGICYIVETYILNTYKKEVKIVIGSNSELKDKWIKNDIDTKRLKRKDYVIISQADLKKIAFNREQIYERLMLSLLSKFLGKDNKSIRHVYINIENDGSSNTRENIINSYYEDENSPIRITYDTSYIVFENDVNMFELINEGMDNGFKVVIV